MVPKIQRVLDRLSEEVIQPTESMQRVFYRSDKESSSPEPLVNIDDSRREGVEQRYVTNKRKLKKKSVPLYIWCLKKNMNNNYPF